MNASRSLSASPGGSGSAQRADPTWAQPAAETLALTRMDWNDDALYDPVPVTVTYSKRLADIIANAPALSGSVQPYRLLI
jgi:hypothetical protein